MNWNFDRARPTEGSLFGRPWAWARDLGLVGAVTCFVVPYLAAPLWCRWEFSVAAAVTGAVTGAALGGLAPRLLHPFVRRIPVLLLLMAGFGLGSLWGALVGGVASLASDVDLALGVQTAAFCGALQLSWFWLPYAVRKARARRTWPVVLGSLIMSLSLAGVLMAVRTL